MRIDLRRRLGVFPIGLDEVLGFSRDGSASPIRRSEKLRLQALVQPECRTRNWHGKAFGKRGALRVKDGRALELIHHAIKRRDRIERSADVVTEDRRQRVGGWPDDGDLPRRL